MRFLHVPMLLTFLQDQLIQVEKTLGLTQQFRVERFGLMVWSLGLHGSEGCLLFVELLCLRLG